MRKIYKREAWLLDEDVLLAGYTAKHKFIPYNKGCGFSCQEICKKDIGNILFYNKEEALKTGFEICE
jgi:hypothetical protein